MSADEQRRLPPRFVPTLTEVLPPDPPAGPAPEAPSDVHWPTHPQVVYASPDELPAPDLVLDLGPAVLAAPAEPALVDAALAEAAVERVMDALLAQLPDILDEALAQVRQRLLEQARASLAQHQQPD